MTQELYKKHRPKRLKDLVGQNEVVKVLKDMIDKHRVPHALLFVGPSGTGKTTVARILKTRLKCGEQDFQEINCADNGSIDMVRGIRDRMSLAPMNGRCRIYLMDEFQSLSRAGFAQQALLKMLEDTPRHVYFVLCTTDPSKIIKTIITRCSVVKFQSVSEEDIQTLVKTVAEKEGISIPEICVEKISEVCEGSPRKALVILDQIQGIENEEEQLDAIRPVDMEEQAINLARCLMDGRKTWKDAAKILLTIEDDPEGIRQLLLAYCRTIILKSGNKRAAHIMDCFREPIYSSPKALLSLAAFDVYHAS